MSETPQQPNQAGKAKESDEDSGLHARALAWGGAAIVGGVLFALGAAWGAREMLRPQGGFGGPNAPGTRAAAPALEAAPQPARTAYEADKQRLVNSYGWVDRDAGVARIPVEQAMRLTAERAATEQRR